MLCLILGISFLLPIFSVFKKSEQTASAISQIPVKEQIVGTTNESLKDNNLLYLDAHLNQTPFDLGTKRPMDGYSITPKVKENGKNEVSLRYQVSPFSLESGLSVFVWIYFPDSPLTNFYSLGIEFSNSRGEKISWDFDASQLYSLMLGVEKVGWKQLELVYNDSNFMTKNYTDVSEKEKTFSYMSVRYESIKDEQGNEFPVLNSTGKLSFYNVFTSTSISAKTAFINSLNYCYYELKPDFIESLQKICVGDTFKLGSIDEIFSYIYVGKQVFPKSGESFQWTIVFGNTLNSENVVWKQNLNFDVEDEYRLILTLSEQKGSNSNLQEVFSKEIVFTVRSYAFGKFSRSAYTINRNETFIFEFLISSDFSLSESSTQPSTVFSLDRDDIIEIESAEYISSLGGYYIKAKALKKGKVTLTATAFGERGSDGNQQIFSESMSISVVENGISDWMKTLLYIILGVCGGVFVIFLIISLVKARRNIVK